MRPSDTSFSSASRATSRRIGSKHDTTTVSGVSSMMTSTPVASSNARMFRPSRPMMRPFISSFGSETADDRALGGVVGRDSLDGERDDLLRLALGVSLGRSRESRGSCWPRRPAPRPPFDGSARSSRPAPTCRPSAPAGDARRRRASRAPARDRRPTSRADRSRSPGVRGPYRAGRAARTCDRERSRARCTRRSSRSTSSRRPRTSTLEVLAELDQLFLAGNHCTLPEVFGLTFCFADDSLAMSLRRSPSPRSVVRAPPYRQPCVLQ